MKLPDSQIDVAVGMSPKDADVVVIYTASNAVPSELSTFVSKHLGLDLRANPDVLARQGYEFVRLSDGTLLAWVSFMDGEGLTEDPISHNLTQALDHFQQHYAQKIQGPVWVPLSGMEVPETELAAAAEKVLLIVAHFVERVSNRFVLNLPVGTSGKKVEMVRQMAERAAGIRPDSSMLTIDDATTKTHNRTAQNSMPAGKMGSGTKSEAFAEADETLSDWSEDLLPLQSVQRRLADEGYYTGPIDGVLTQDVIFSIEGYLQDEHDTDLENDGARVTLFGVFPELPDTMVSEIEAGFSSNQPVDDPDAPDTTTMTGGYHSDHPVEALENDTLGRAAIADAIAENVLHVWPDHRARRRPMAVHLSGRWGSGKSSILNFLRHRLEQDMRFVQHTSGRVDVKHQKGWVVADFNAWRMQDAGPPWWSLCNILIDAAQGSVGSRRIARRLKVRDWLWQEWKLSSPVLFLLGMVLSVIAIWMVIEITQDLGRTSAPQPVAVTDMPDKLTTITEVKTTAADGTVTTERVVVDRTPPPPDKPVPFWQPVLGLASFIGGISALLSFLKGFNRTSSETAEALRNLRGDPDAELKNRYKRVVAEIGKPVAVFIDDLDRCRADFVVELLQGLQTAYADLPVLYVVAADRDWIVSAYNQTFEGFQPEIAKPGQPLGYLFVKKIFQLSVNVPDLGAAQAAQLTEELLGAQTAPSDDSDLTPELLRDLDLAAIDRADTLQELTTVALNIGRARRSGTVTREMFAKVREQSAQTEIKHVLLGYTELFDGNPRAIKRLVNALTFRKGYALMGGVDISFDVLARFTILDMRFPYTAAHLAQFPQKVDPAARDKPRKDAPAADAKYFHDPMIDKILEGLTEEDIIAVRAFG